MSVLLLTSGAYVSDELSAEFGRLPPTFLPVGNKRLYYIQAMSLGSAVNKVVLTIPESFRVPVHDREVINDLGVELLPVIEGMTLGEAIVYALNLLGINDLPVQILHGDTLITEIDQSQRDVVSVHEAKTFYSWATIEESDDGRTEITEGGSDRGEAMTDVLSGYFSFSSSLCLIQSITRARGDFIGGLNIYSKSRNLRPFRTPGKWLDFGHLQTFYESRWYLTTQRVFNDLQISRQVVTKYSDNQSKLCAEAAWFDSIPPRMRVFTPTYLGLTGSNERSGYKLAHEYLSTLADLYVFGRLSITTWDHIFAACADFLDACLTYQAPKDISEKINALYGEKTRKRMADYASNNGLNLDRPWNINKMSTPSLNNVIDHLEQIVSPKETARSGLMHGDFCFSNIFYDFRRQSIKVIDPRGHLHNSEPSIFGDLRYDVAKLTHSVLGCYDFIVTDYFHCRRVSDYSLTLDIPSDPLIRQIQDAFVKQKFAGFTPNSPEVLAATALLFLSMLPLHQERPDRQHAFLANALLLYRSLDGG
jgi:hypothetical protein